MANPTFSVGYLIIGLANVELQALQGMANYQLIGKYIVLNCLEDGDLLGRICSGVAVCAAREYIPNGHLLVPVPRRL